MRVHTNRKVSTKSPEVSIQRTDPDPAANKVNIKVEDNDVTTVAKSFRHKRRQTSKSVETSPTLNLCSKSRKQKHPTMNGNDEGLNSSLKEIPIGKKQRKLNEYFKVEILHVGSKGDSVKTSTPVLCKIKGNDELIVEDSPISDVKVEANDHRANDDDEQEVQRMIAKTEADSSNSSISSSKILNNEKLLKSEKQSEKGIKQRGFWKEKAYDG